MLSDELFVEARRQLSICNSCRYCAAYCPVWPALEEHTELSTANVVDLANLCHDCRDCYDACMYTAPHEFDLNPPALFAAVREQTYEEFAWPGRRPAWLRGPLLIACAFAAVCVLLAAIGYLTTDAVLPGATSGSAYDVIGHWALVAVVMVPSVWALVAFAASAWRFWITTHGDRSGLLDAAAWLSTARQAATLRHQTGGGTGCTYPSELPSQSRRRWHHFVAYGFASTFVSTVSASIGEYLLGDEAPHGYLSVPVITGTLGGIAMTIGCAALLVLKRRAAPALTTSTMRRADLGLLWALVMLSVTGLAVLCLRNTALFAPVLVVHVGAVIVAFALAPYTKFMHWIYRVLAIHDDNVRRRERGGG